MEHDPKAMRTAAIDRFGGPDVLTLHRMPVPVIDKNEVLIALDTMGVGPWDAGIREGWYQGDQPPGFPLVLGSDGAGVVAQVGSRVRASQGGRRRLFLQLPEPVRKGRLLCRIRCCRRGASGAYT